MGGEHVLKMLVQSNRGCVRQSTNLDTFPTYCYMGTVREVTYSYKCFSIKVFEVL
jgi:hypothetical protein